jgi:hypothetical protein
VSRNLQGYNFYSPQINNPASTWLSNR